MFFISQFNDSKTFKLHKSQKRYNVVLFVFLFFSLFHEFIIWHFSFYFIWKTTKFIKMSLFFWSYFSHKGPTVLLLKIPLTEVIYTLSNIVHATLAPNTLALFCISFSHKKLNEHPPDVVFPQILPKVVHTLCIWRTLWILQRNMGILFVPMWECPGEELPSNNKCKLTFCSF